MQGYSGPCRIACADDTSVPATASLVDDGNGGWFGRLTSVDFDWFAAKHAGSPIVLRFPTGAIGTVAVVRFTILLPTQATVTGVGPSPR